MKTKDPSFKGKVKKVKKGKSLIVFKVKIEEWVDNSKFKENPIPGKKIHMESGGKKLKFKK